MISRRLTFCRAYIAASRRSDRSLEARVESARRASDMHKKRTGRALQVTEADVLNEAMYEEIIDLPSRRGLSNSHYEAQHADFDRRLLAYLGAQVGTRSVLADTMSSHRQDGYLDGRGQPVTNYMPQHLPQQHPAGWQHDGQIQQQEHHQLYHHHKQPPALSEPHNHYSTSPTPYYDTSARPLEHQHSQSGRSGSRPGSRSRPLSISTSLSPSMQYQHARSPQEYQNKAILQQDSNMAPPRLSLSQRYDRAGTKTHSPSDMPRKDSAIGATSQNTTSQQCLPYRFQPYARSHSSQSPLSTALPAQTQHILASGISEVARQNISPGVQHHPGIHGYSYNPNYRPRSSQNSQTYPPGMLHITDVTRFQHPAVRPVNRNSGSGDLHRRPSYHEIPVSPACYNTDETNVHENLTADPLMPTEDSLEPQN